VSTTTTSRPGGAEQKILDALRQLQQATAAAIADHAGVAYSTTTAKLRTMQQAGRVLRLAGKDGQSLWQTAPPATRDADTPTADTPTVGQQPQPDDAADARISQASSRPARNTPGSKATGGKPTGKKHAGRNGAANGQPARAGHSTAGDEDKDETAAAAPHSAATDAVARPSTPAPHKPADPRNGDSSAGSPPPRRAKGVLRAQVLAVLQDHPDQVFKVSQVCKQLPGASAGAIANALYKLAADGNARQVADKPAAYQAE
jgi:hypothetical protein